MILFGTLLVLVTIRKHNCSSISKNDVKLNVVCSVGMFRNERARKS